MAQQKVTGVQISASVDDLNDTTITSPANGQVLTYQSGTWVNQSVAPSAIALDNLTDATITSPTNGQVLTYQSGTWVNQNAAGGGSETPTFIAICSGEYEIAWGNENHAWNWVLANQPSGYGLDLNYFDDVYVPAIGYYLITVRGSIEPRFGGSTTFWPNTLTTYGSRLNTGFPFNTELCRTTHSRYAATSTHTNDALGAGPEQIVQWTDTYVVGLQNTVASDTGTPRFQVGIRATTTGSPTSSLRLACTVSAKFLTLGNL